MIKYIRPNLISLNANNVLDYIGPAQNSNYFQVHYTQSEITILDQQGQTTSDGSPLSYIYNNKDNVKTRIVKAQIVNDEVVIS